MNSSFSISTEKIEHPKPTDLLLKFILSAYNETDSLSTEVQAQDKLQQPWNSNYTCELSFSAIHSTYQISKHKQLF